MDFLLSDRSSGGWTLFIFNTSYHISHMVYDSDSQSIIHDAPFGFYEILTPPFLFLVQKREFNHYTGSIYSHKTTLMVSYHTPISHTPSHSHIPHHRHGAYLSNTAHSQHIAQSHIKLVQICSGRRVLGISTVTGKYFNKFTKRNNLHKTTV